MLSHYSQGFIRAGIITRRHSCSRRVQVQPLMVGNQSKLVRSFLKKGLRVQIANGQDTDFWEYQWLPVVPPRKAMFNRIPLKVSDFIDDQSYTWNVEKLSRYLPPDEVELASSICLTRYAQKDRYIWPFMKTMEYTAKSGYWAATHVSLEDDNIQQPEGSVILKKQIWKLKIIPKIQHFLWKSISGALPTLVQLCTRGIKTDPVCQRCCLEEETIAHALFLCPHAQAIWHCSGFSNTSLFTENVEENLSILFGINNNGAESQSICQQSFWTIWFIWKSRNEFLFQKRNVHPIEDARRAVEENEEWMIQVSSESQKQIKVDRSSQWHPPPFGWLKCNFDCSYRCNGNTGVGWIVRDETGKYMGSGMVKLYEISSALEGEAMAFLIALQQVWSKGWRNVWFKGDSIELTNIINQPLGDHIKLGNAINDIRYWMSRLPLCSLESVNRERNAAADKMSKEAHNISSEFVFCNLPSIWLMEYLYFPYTI